MEEFAVGEPAPAQRSKLPELGSDFFPWCTGAGRVAFPLGRPVLAVAGDVKSSDELEHVAPARAKGARALERGHGRHREREVGRRGHHRRTDLLCKSHEVVDPQAKTVVYHLTHDSPRRGAREQDEYCPGCVGVGRQTLT